LAASEISYAKRAIYTFGGASFVNVPVDRYFKFSLSSPTSSAWEEFTQRMPRARFGHRAVSLGR
jgi:hypothetical protein